jgi:hypothetical protein
MVKQVFDIDGYWEVIVYWNVDYSFFSDVEDELKRLGASDRQVKELYDTMVSGEAKAVTCNSVKKHRSVVLFNKYEDQMDFVNSVIHEAEHVKQAMLEAYQVEDKGEPPAYTIGYLVGKMWEVFKGLVCITCKHTEP